MSLWLLVKGVRVEKWEQHAPGARLAGAQEPSSRTAAPFTEDSHGSAQPGTRIAAR